MNSIIRKKTVNERYLRILLFATKYRILIFIASYPALSQAVTFPLQGKPILVSEGSTASNCPIGIRPLGHTLVVGTISGE
ncbi:hypothetical protein [Virgibacillus sp. Bac332]|uniref:hypothetical protein n=1 Tax=Virgibacillus sp. Bac332 TaxID=2419842 RepID=UPI000EF54221|nr:hypothetical protein [Virgibacillus sp. Bac332]